MRVAITKRPHINLKRIEFISVKHLPNGIHNKELNAMYNVAIGENFLGDYLVLHQPKATYVFMSMGKMLGFAIPRKNNEDEWRVGAIYTLPQYRGGGVSKEFLNRFFDESVDVVASIEPHNTSSIKLFTSCGFKVNSKPYKDKDSTTLIDYLRKGK